MPTTNSERFPEHGPRLPLPAAVPSFGDAGLDAIMAVALEAGATITKVETAPQQLALFEEAA